MTDDQPKQSIHDQLSQAMPDQPELALAISESINEARNRVLTRQNTGLPAVSLRLVPFRSRWLSAVFVSGFDGVKRGHSH
jgi:hypothetical protein